MNANRINGDQARVDIVGKRFMRPAPADSVTLLQREYTVAVKAMIALPKSPALWAEGRGAVFEIEKELRHHLAAKSPGEDRQTHKSGSLYRRPFLGLKDKASKWCNAPMFFSCSHPLLVCPSRCPIVRTTHLYMSVPVQHGQRAQMFADDVADRKPNSRFTTDPWSLNHMSTQAFLYSRAPLSAILLSGPRPMHTCAILIPATRRQLIVWTTQGPLGQGPVRTDSNVMRPRWGWGGGERIGVELYGRKSRGSEQDSQRATRTSKSSNFTTDGAKGTRECRMIA
ncbi:unnamed protein product [Protopolystoma xenopodis]|uniref:Uncharacterized protein n=1 Tax=Protopolystoma xenopodis TaxID=117903 RepID=A0A448WM82_9PLAT|nr:unnamed protein product [Protopolystoma xenopodis]